MFQELILEVNISHVYLRYKDKADNLIVSSIKYTFFQTGMRIFSCKCYSNEI